MIFVLARFVFRVPNFRFRRAFALPFFASFNFLLQIIAHQLNSPTLDVLNYSSAISERFRPFLYRHFRHQFRRSSILFRHSGTLIQLSLFGVDRLQSVLRVDNSTHRCARRKDDVVRRRRASPLTFALFQIQRRAMQRDVSGQTSSFQIVIFHVNARLTESARAE